MFTKSQHNFFPKPPRKINSCSQCQGVQPLLEPTSRDKQCVRGLPPGRILKYFINYWYFGLLWPFCSLDRCSWKRKIYMIHTHTHICIYIHNILCVIYMVTFRKPKHVCIIFSDSRCKRCRFDPWVGQILLEKEMAIHSSILAWKIPWTEEPIHGVAKSWTWLTDLACTHTYSKAKIVCHLSWYIIYRSWGPEKRSNLPKVKH